MIQSVAFVVYPVTDVARAQKFYEGALGLKLTHRWEDQWLEYDIGDTTLAIAKADTEHPAGAKGAILAFEVRDLDVFVNRLKQHSAELVGEIIDTPVCRMANVRDPDGNELIIHKRKTSG